MANFITGALTTVQSGVEARNDVTVAIRNFFPNRDVLFTRLPQVGIDRTDFDLYTHPYRPSSFTLTTAISATTTTGLVTADTSYLMNHDVLALVDSTGAIEHVQVNGDPTSATTFTVSRGFAGTTPVSTIATTASVFLSGSSRTGGEIDQTGVTTKGTKRTQYTQTFQHPVQIFGAAQSALAQVFPAGIQTPLDFNETMQLQHLVDDFERTMYYGIAQAPTTSLTAAMDGIRTIINGVGNLTTAPVNATTYSPVDFTRDLLQKSDAGGGAPDLLIVSSEFITGLATWGFPVQRIPAGETRFGTPIDTFECPFLGGMTIVKAPLLRPYTAIALTMSEVFIRMKRPVYWNLRGNRGDMIEGEWIAEGAIQLINAEHHAMVEGISGFSST